MSIRTIPGSALAVIVALPGVQFLNYAPRPKGGPPVGLSIILRSKDLIDVGGHVQPDRRTCPWHSANKPHFVQLEDRR